MNGGLELAGVLKRFVRWPNATHGQLVTILDRGPPPAPPAQR